MSHSLLVGSDFLVGCRDDVGCVVGAEQLATSAGVWVKARFYKQGHYLCATVYSVAAGEPRIFELKVDLRPIERALVRAHTAMHAKDIARATVRGGMPDVGWSLDSMWKGVKTAAKKIGRSKLVKGVVSVTKAVGKGVKAVAKSKAFGAVLAVGSAFPLTAPFAAPALAAYAAANTAIEGVETGKQLVQTAKRASSIIKEGARAVGIAKSVTKSAGAAVKSAGALMSPAARAKVAANAKAAGKVQLSAQGKAAVARAITALPTQAAKALAAQKVKAKLAATAKTRTQVALARHLPPAASASVINATKAQAAAQPLATLAARTAAKLKDPLVRSKLLAMKTKAEKSRAVLEGVQQRAKLGDLDAQKSAAIVNLVARNRARIQAMTQTSAAGLPGLLITPRGKIVRGRFRIEAKAGSRGMLYQGPGKSQAGSYATVSGPIGADIMIGCGCVHGSSSDAA